MARTRGRDSLGPAKQPRGQRRRVVHVFTEGSVTEPGYIEIVRAIGTYRDPSVPVEVRIANQKAPPSHRKPLGLVEEAARLMREETRRAGRGGLDKAYLPQVWCMFDRDQHEGVDTALKLADEAGVRVAFSHPCFEVWRVLHHKPVTGTFGANCDMAAARLPFAATTAHIKVVERDQLTGGPGEGRGFAEAKKRALKMNEAHGDHVPKSLRDPYTDVFSFVEDGLGIVAY
jgi:hypothetical protein